ncbi:SPFH domain-containing protein [Streptomyces sp. 2P-4]|uniref:SPFH domain-containing protein n=1 Tax=Streptomyces sp. 2P-4 TaxID=2931974 RepID=UPI00253FAAD1|nr:SPFH domain-containing protein [Streptomyces sp. 2P-4]
MPAAGVSPYADPAGPSSPAGRHAPSPTAGSAVAAAAAVAQTRLYIGPAARVAVASAPVRSRWVAGVPAAMVLTAREILLPNGRTAGNTALGDVPAARTEPGHAPAAAADGSGTASGGEEGGAPDAPATATLDIPHPAAAPDPQAAPPAAATEAADKDAPSGPHGASRDGTPGPAAEPGTSGGRPGAHEADPTDEPDPYTAEGADGVAGIADRPVGVPGPSAGGGEAATGGAEAEGDGVAAVRGSVVEIVSRAVARGIEDGGGEPAQGSASAAARGVDVTAVPVHLPFPAEPRTLTAGTPAAAPGRPARRAVPRPAPGRRVPQGDDRLREHRGPVLPGWVGVAVGGLALSGCLAVLWRAGAVPDAFGAAFGAAPRAYQGLRATHWPPLAFLGIVALLSLGGLGRGKVGHAWVLTLFGRYRGTVRRTGLTWVSPLLLRRRIDVRLRHWRSDPMPAVDCGGLALQVVVQVVWQVKDTARAALAVEDHTEYLAEQVEAAMARVLSQLPADAFHEDAPTLRDTEAVGEALTRMLAAETEAVGIEVYSAQPTRIEYAPEVAEAMRRRRVAAIDAKHRDTVLTSVVDAVDDTVHRLTSRGLVELDDYERKALVKDLTVAFYTGRPE